MRPYANRGGEIPPKLSTGKHAGRVAGPPGPYHDKTQFSQARPGAKEKIRNAKRMLKHSARRQFKKACGEGP